ncbi:single-stranded DNA-binding protein [Nocardioides sp. Bht2]|uniref:single-stranded DNA-binding protein n=1 Tax=Nocardioides sp. Bht2 TaxID=3392297 RepID=UPI0039B60BBA
MLDKTPITFAGNLAADPQINFTPNGDAVANFTVMVNRRVKRGDSWEDGPATSLLCELWQKNGSQKKEAEMFVESARRGDRVIGHGEVYTQTWEKDGETRYRDQVRVIEVGMSTAWKVVQVKE